MSHPLVRVGQDRTTRESVGAPRRFARGLYRHSPQELIEIAGRRYAAVAKRRRTAPPLTEAFLRSPAYTELMDRHVPHGRAYGRHEAQTATKSFMFRAFEVEDHLRAFRWRGVQEHLDTFLEVLTDPDALVADLGGAGAPFGLGSVVVDRLPFDADGTPVPYRSLDELPRPAEAILSSHTLEHIPELDAELRRIREALVPGGRFLALLPAFTCERWRTGRHAHAEYGDHVWTFGLSETTELPEGLIAYVEADTLLACHFDVETACYCGDDSIFLACRRG